MKRARGDSSSHGGGYSTLGDFFRRQLYEMVDDPSTDSIVSWSKSGKSFIVWDDAEFRKSFRCFEFVGFRRVESESESEHCEYACDYFVRGQPELTPPDKKGSVITPALASQIEAYEKRKHSRTDSSNSSLLLPRELYDMADSHRLTSTPLFCLARDPSWSPPGAFHRILRDLVDDPSTDSILSWSGARAARVSSFGMKMSSAELFSRGPYYSRIWLTSPARLS